MSIDKFYNFIQVSIDKDLCDMCDLRRVLNFIKDRFDKVYIIGPYLTFVTQPHTILHYAS